MARKGRKPLGLGHVDRLSASDLAKERLKAILGTMSGDMTIPQASATLGICPARFHALRHGCLESSVKALEPGRMGRPPKTPESVDAEELARLRAENESLRHELQVAGVRQEIAAVLPQVVATSAESLKKTTSAGHRGTRTCVKRSSSRHKPRRP
jgi:hypothetical protein